MERVIRAIEGSRFLDRAGEVARPAVTAVVGKGTRLDVVTGRWLGHAVHPAAVVFPTACWTGGVLLDAVGGADSASAARRLIGLGVLGAVPAAVSGGADWLDTSGAEQRVGALHAALNLAATGLFAASWTFRVRGRRLPGTMISAVGIGVIGVAAHLGGHLAYRRGVGVNTTAFQSGPTEWCELQVQGSLDDGEAHGATVAGLPMVAVRSAGVTAVLEDRCTHRGAPLSDGTIDDGCVVCPWHGSRFDLGTGAVRRGPAAVPQPAYEVTIDGPAIRVRRGENGGLRRNPAGNPS